MASNNTGKPIRFVSIKETDPAIQGLKTDFSVELSEPKITENHTARFRITLLNQSNSRQKYATGFAPPFPVMTDEDSCWMLVDSSWDFTPVSKTCWAIRDETDYIQLKKVIADSASMAQTVDANDSLSKEYELWSVPDGERCMPTGTFRFEADYTVEPTDERFTWGFSISVGSP